MLGESSTLTWPKFSDKGPPTSTNPACSQRFWSIRGVGCPNLEASFLWLKHPSTTQHLDEETSDLSWEQKVGFHNIGFMYLSCYHLLGELKNWFGPVTFHTLLCSMLPVNKYQSVQKASLLKFQVTSDYNFEKKNEGKISIGSDIAELRC